MSWIIWIAIALVLILLQIISMDLVLLMLAGGALAAALTSTLTDNVIIQIVVFAITSTALLMTLRPWLLKYLRQRVALVETNVQAIIGKPAVVVSEVSSLSGRVKLQGEVWSARTESGELTLPTGTKVTVLRIDGATAVVAPQTMPTSSAQTD